MVTRPVSSTEFVIRVYRTMPNTEQRYGLRNRFTVSLHFTAAKGRALIMTTLRNSLAASILVHGLIFGGALAFARYADMVFQPRLDAVQVSLVTSEQIEAHSETSQNTGQDSPIRENNIVEQDQSVSSSEKNDDQSVQRQVDVAQSIDDPGQSPPGPDREQEGGVRSELVGAEYLGLFEAIEKVKKYPRLARERGMEGVVRIRFRLDRSGGIENIKVVKSSGHEILDRASISAVYRAVPMPYVNGWVDMPMKFVLK